MNKLLKVTLITAIMATSGMCMSGECQRTTFTEATEYKLGHTASHGSTWITENTGDTAVITGDVKITDGSRWIHNKGGIKLEGKDNIIDNSELINEGGIGVYNEGKLDIIKSSVSVEGDGAYIDPNNSTVNVKDNSCISIKDGNYTDITGGCFNVEYNSEISIKNTGEMGINESTFNVKGDSIISIKDKGHIAVCNGSINVEDKSTICLKDSAYIFVDSNSTIIINEGCIFDARDSKDLREWNTEHPDTSSGTFNMEAGSIMYLPKEVTKKANMFIITLPSEGDKPVELRYIQHTDITFDGLCPNVTHSGCKYKLSDWEKGTDTDTGITYIQEPNTGIGFTWKGIDENANAIPSSIAKLVPIYTWSVSTKCDGEDVKILESRDLQCCDDIL